MVVSFFPQGGALTRGFTNWQEMGAWYGGLTTGRRDASPQIKQQVAALTPRSSTPLDKMKALAQFTQHDVRYVSIQLGIGGFQPHPAADIFAHRYGDCKDKATLMSSMLSQIGIDSYYLVINTERGAVGPDMPANIGAFNHVILAIKLPPNAGAFALRQRCNTRDWGLSSTSIRRMSSRHSERSVGTFSRTTDCW